MIDKVVENVKNVIALLGFLGVMASAWFSLGFRVDFIDGELKRLQVRDIAELRAEYAQHLKECKQENGAASAALVELDKKVDLVLFQLKMKREK